MRNMPRDDATARCFSGYGELSVLHASVMNRISRGKVEQLTEEIRAVEKLGLSWDTKVFVPYGCDRNAPSSLTVIDETVEGSSNQRGLSGLSAHIRLRRNFFRWLKDVQDQYDLLLLRYTVHDVSQYKFLRAAERPVVLVHHSLEVSELAGDGAVGRMRALLESMVGKRTLKYSSGIIGVTPEVLRYELRRIENEIPPGFVYPNGGIDGTVPVPDHRESTPTFLFISSTFAPWHGLDLLLHAAKRSASEFKVHVVGEVDSSRLQSSGAARDGRFRFHGSLGREGIRRLAAESWLGLSSFGLERNDMKQSCSMKVRDYLAMGLPTYGRSKDIFPADFQYYITGPTDFEHILRVAESLRYVERAEVSRVSQPLISKRVLLSNLYEALKRTYSSRKS